MREARIPSQRQLALKANLRPATITRWVQEETKAIRPNDIAPVARILNVSPSWLLTGQGPMRLEGVAESPTPYHSDAPLDVDLLGEVLEAVADYLATKKLELPPKVHAALVATFYAECLRVEGMRADLPNRIQPFIRLALAGAG